MQQVKLSKVRTMQQELLLLAEAAESANGKIFIHGGGVDRHSVLADARPPLQLKADIALASSPTGTRQIEHMSWW